MSDNKTYYWLKLPNDFFRNLEMKRLRKLAGGDTYTVIYLKMMLLSLEDNGVLYYDGICPTFSEELSLELDEDEDHIQVVLNFLKSVGLLQAVTANEIELTQVPEMTGSETDVARRVRKHRRREELKGKPDEIDDVQVTFQFLNSTGLMQAINESEFSLEQLSELTGSETRQAKIMRRKRSRINALEESSKKGKNHIPYIENYNNNKRYGGKYYEVFNRDNGICKSCGSNQNLCVHHIIGFDENNNKTVNLSSMVVLCRKCHSKEHNHPHEVVTDEMLKDINFDFDLYDGINNLNGNSGNKVTKELPPSYDGVTKGYTEIEKEIEKELEDLIGVVRIYEE